MRDSHRGERRSQFVDERHVVEAAHRDVARYAQPQLRQGVVAAEREKIVRRHHRREAPIFLPERQKRTPALLLGESVTGCDPPCAALEMAVLQRPQESAVASEAGRKGQRASQVGNPRVPGLAHVLDRQLDAVGVVADDPGDLPVFHRAVEQHQGDFLSQAVLHQRIAPTSSRHDQPVDPTGKHIAQNGALAALVVVGVRQNRGVPDLGECVLDGADHRRKERIGDVRDEHPDDPGSVRLQPRGNGIRLIRECIRGFGHALRNLGGNHMPRAGVEHPGHRRGVHSGAASNFA